MVFACFPKAMWPAGVLLLYVWAWRRVEFLYALFVNRLFGIQVVIDLFLTHSLHCALLGVPICRALFF